MSNCVDKDPVEEKKVLSPAWSNSVTGRDQTNYKVTS